MPMFIGLFLNLAFWLLVFLFYLYLIGEKKVRWKYLLPIVVGYYMAASLLIHLTGDARWYSIIVILLYFIGVFYISKPINKLWNLTASLGSLAIISLLKDLFQSILFDIFAYSSWLPILPPSQDILTISIIFLYILLFLCRNLLVKLGDFIEKSTWLPIYLGIIFIINIFLLLIAQPNMLLSGSNKILDLSKLYPLMFFVFFLFLILFLIDSKRKVNYQLIKEKQTADKEYLNYVHELEKSYLELASFRHDYQNILFALDEGIQDGDLTKVKKVYQETVAPTSELFTKEQNELVKLQLIQNEEIRSLFRVKLLTAQAKNLRITIDIPEKISKIPISIIKLIRISSIILDNAMEEAEQSASKELVLAFFMDQDKLNLIVRNSCVQKNISMTDIYKFGQSSKKEGGRGIGLNSLNHILQSEPCITTATHFDKGYFTQEIRISF